MMNTHIEMGDDQKKNNLNFNLNMNRIISDHKHPRVQEEIRP